MLIESDNKLLQTHLFLFELNDLICFSFSDFLFPILIESHGHDDEQAKAMILDRLSFMF